MARIRGCKEYAVFARYRQWEFYGFAVTVKGNLVAIDDKPVRSVSWEDYEFQLVERYGLGNVRLVEFG